MDGRVKPFRRGAECTGNTGSAGGSVTIDVFSYDEVVQRSNPLGGLIRYQIASQWAVTELEVDLEGDGEPSQVVTYKVGPGRDGRYWSAVAIRPTINGTWPLVLRATTNNGRVGSVRCTPGMTVTF